MRHILIAGFTLALAAPLAAQPSLAPAPSEEAPTPARATDPSPIADAAAVVATSEFATYDTDKSGQLDRREFSAWFAARHAAHDGAHGQPGATDVQVAFTKADADKNKHVSEQELGQFLAG